MGLRKRRYMFVVVLLCWTSMTLWATDANVRYALVIGNSAYQKMTSLPNPVNDATDMASALEGNGFTVDLVTDATLGEMSDAVGRFVSAVNLYGTEAALFYYAGHGVQYEGVNFLVPVNADIQEGYELLDKSLTMDSVARGMDYAGSSFNLIILDACRDNPFSATRGGSGRGLSAKGAEGRGSMVVFATAPGSVAEDGRGRNSPFTRAFLGEMAIPGVEIRDLVTAVQRKVQEQTDGRQVPWQTSSYTGEFYFQTMEQQLAKNQGALAGLESELLALEREIALRETAIKAAGTVEERRRLEAQQAKSKALEVAKQLEAQRASDMERQTQEILDSQEAQDSLRKEMDQRLASEKEALALETKQKKAELAALGALQAETGQSLQARLETIAQYNRTILDIQRRYAQLIQSMITDFDTLHEAKVAAFRTENPRDPWETVAEYESRLTGRLTILADATEADKGSQSGELERRLQEEVAPLTALLKSARTELHGKRYEVPSDRVTVHVGPFDAEAKHFPITVSVQDGLVKCTQSLFYTIESRDREILKSEYYKVYSAVESGALVGKVAYRVFETSEGLWTVVPEYVEVLNLLEEDAVLSKAWERGKLVVTSPIAVLRVDDTVLSMSLGSIEQNILIVGVPEGATVSVDGVQQPLQGSIFMGSVGTAQLFDVRIASPWIFHDVVIPSWTPLGYGKIAFCDVSLLVEPFGNVLIPRPDLAVAVFKGKDTTSKVPMDFSENGYSARLAPGEYRVSARVPEDRYDAFSASFIVKANERNVFDPGPVHLSLLHRYEDTLREREALQQAFDARFPMKTLGWSSVGVAAAGVVGTVVSYLLYAEAKKNYEGAVLSSDLTRYRNQVELYNKLFTVSAAVGVSGGVTGGTALAIDTFMTKSLTRQIAEKDQQAAELKRLIGAQKAREAMHEAAGSLDFLDARGTGTSGQDIIVWFSPDGGSMNEPNQRICTPASRIGPLPLPARAGFVFEGWWTSLGSNGVQVDAQTLVGEGTPFVVYAKWMAKKYSVLFDTNGGGVVPPLLDLLHGTEIAEPELQARSGYLFGGWFKEIGYVNQWDFEREKVVEDTTLYAKWDRVYTLADTGPAGGYIFYDKSSYSGGWRYLEAAPASTEWRDKPWASKQSKSSVGTAASIGAGAINTEKIVAKYGSGETRNSRSDYAAKLCSDLVVSGYDDWFLPSKGELVLMHTNLHKKGLGGFSDTLYWSSSENVENEAWLEYFSKSGTKYDPSQNYRYRVRAARAF